MTYFCEFIVKNTKLHQNKQQKRIYATGLHSRKRPRARKAGVMKYFTVLKYCRHTNSNQKEVNKHVQSVHEDNKVKQNRMIDRIRG